MLCWLQWDASTVAAYCEAPVERSGVGPCRLWRRSNSQQAEAGRRLQVVMQAASPALPDLAGHQRWLRGENWPGVRVTQSAPTKAVSEEGLRAAAAVPSWEDPGSPKLLPGRR